jgi:prolyl-tRNA synthetase
LHTLRTTPSGIDAERERSYAWLVRAGFIHQLTAGVYTYGPLIVRVLRKIEAIIREEHEAVGGQEILMPALQPATLWEESGRLARYTEEGILYRLEDRRGRAMCLGPTHEEVVTDFARSVLRSHKQLPQLFFQIQTKFRDERRPRAGLLRAREFIMKDAYSFDSDRAGMERSYATMRRVYSRIFERCGLTVMPVEADSGVIGGSISEEFMVLSDLGEDTIVLADGRAANIERGDAPGERRKAIEVGHIFQLGLRYSDAMKATFADEQQEQRSFWMGCYGIGVTRVVQAIVDQRSEMIWPRAIAPYQVHLIQTRRDDPAQTALAERIDRAVPEMLWDDRELSAGAKLADADLLGLPIRIVVGRGASEGEVELLDRAIGAVKQLRVEEAIALCS